MVMFLNSYILHGYVSACATALLLLPALQRLKCLLSSALRELLPTPDLRPFEPYCPNSALKCVAKIETDLWPNPFQQKRQGCLVTRQALLSRSVSLGGAAPASLSLSLSLTHTHTHTHTSHAGSGKILLLLVGSFCCTKSPFGIQSPEATRSICVSFQLPDTEGFACTAQYVTGS